MLTMGPSSGSSRVPRTYTIHLCVASSESSRLSGHRYLSIITAASVNHGGACQSSRRQLSIIMVSHINQQGGARQSSRRCPSTITVAPVNDHGVAYHSARRCLSIIMVVPVMTAAPVNHRGGACQSSRRRLSIITAGAAT